MKQQQYIVILGSGESGAGAALLAQSLGHRVFVSDKGAMKDVYKQILTEKGIPFEELRHSMEAILSADLVIKSPGIPEKTDVMKAVRAQNIPVIGEIEYGWLHRPAGSKIVAITGSNGKTTTTLLAHHLLKTAGMNAQLGGNVGHSFAQLVMEDRASGAADLVYVLEVSSFQLDDCDQFKPDIAILLNITPDHLDRYDYQMENYVRSKFRIAMNQGPDELLITNADDPEIQNWISAHPESVAATLEAVRRDDLLDGYVRIGDEYAFDMTAGNLKGPHNMFNAACAIRAALRLGADPECLEEGLYSFATPPHRMEKVAVLDGVTWINDSKATNVDSVYHALQSMDGPTVWIVGGQDKGNDYSVLMPYVQKWVKAIVCMGLDNSKIIAAFQHLGLPMTETRGAAEAVAAAAAFAEGGDTVLLSPACASFDLFKNYEDRGDQFREEVLKL